VAVIGKGSAYLAPVASSSMAVSWIVSFHTCGQRKQEQVSGWARVQEQRDLQRRCHSQA
jgi:hypothetical protein